MITIARMRPSEISRIGEIDRSEHVVKAYVFRHGTLDTQDVDWQVPGWTPEGEGDHSVEGMIRLWRPVLDRGGVLLGAFDGDDLVGLAIYRPGPTEDMGQLALLYVTRDRRRQGIGSALTRAVIGRARTDGAARLYVSSIPSAPSVEFYRRHGFEPTVDPDPELYALEPDDIHMVMVL